MLTQNVGITPTNSPGLSCWKPVLQAKKCTSPQETLGGKPQKGSLQVFLRRRWAFGAVVAVVSQPWEDRQLEKSSDPPHSVKAPGVPYKMRLRPGLQHKSLWTFWGVEPAPVNDWGVRADAVSFWPSSQSKTLWLRMHQMQENSCRVHSSNTEPVAEQNIGKLKL